MQASDHQKDKQVSPRTNQPSLEAKVTKLRLSYFGHIIRRQDSLEKAIVVGKVENSRKRGKPSMRWTNSLRFTRAEQNC